MRVKYGLSILVAVAVLLALQFFQESPRTKATDTAGSGADGMAALMKAFERRESKLWVEIGGRVTRILPDDRRGSRHQRFVLELDNGHTLLVAHNIDLARRAPISKGDWLRIRGRYEWNQRGGVLHWTHHDPRGHIRGGWIELRGERYSHAPMFDEGVMENGRHTPEIG